MASHDVRVNKGSWRSSFSLPILGGNKEKPRVRRNQPTTVNKGNRTLGFFFTDTKGK